MYELTDWNCRLLPGGLFPELSASQNADAIKWLQSRYHFSRFCMMADYDCKKESVTEFILKRDRALRLLRDALPENTKLIAAGSALLVTDLSTVAELDRLTLPSGRFLPLSMPIGAYADWMDTELNRLLYKRHLSPLFLSFERCILLYSPEIVKKLLRVPHAAFQFGFHTLADPKITRVMSALLEKRTTVLLGSGLGAPQKLSTFDFDYYREQAKVNLDVADIQQLFHISHVFYRED